MCRYEIFVSSSGTVSPSFKAVMPQYFHTNILSKCQTSTASCNITALRNGGTAPGHTSKSVTYTTDTPTTKLKGKMMKYIMVLFLAVSRQ